MAKTLNKAARIIFGNKEKKQFPDPEGLEREKPSSAIEGSTQPIGFETRLRAKFSEQANEIGIETRHKEEMKTKGMRQTFAKRSSVRPKHLQHPAPIQGGHYKQTPQMEKPHYEEYEKMENKTFTQFVTEAKRGRPRKLKPGEQADTEHLQDQLSKLTHANHVTVHFKNGEKHEIPRAHANKALIHLSGLKPIHRADHVEHMHSSKENFYHTLSTKSIPSKKKTITLAGPKLRKEEVGDDDFEKPSDTTAKAAAKKLYAPGGARSKNGSKAGTPFMSGSNRVVVPVKHSDGSVMHYHHEFDSKDGYVHPQASASMKSSHFQEEVEQIDEAGMALPANHKTAIASHIKKMWGKGKVTFDKQNGMHTVSHSDGIQTHVHSIRIKGGKAQVTHFMDMDEEVEQIDELTGKKKKPFGKDPLSAVANRAINRMKLPPNDGSKLSPEEIASNNKNSKVSRMAFDRMEEEVESDEKKKKDHHKLLQKFRHRIDEVKAIKGKHANKLHAAPVINPGKVGYAGKGTKPKVQSLRREDYAPLEDGEKQTHVDQKTANAKSRVQGGEKPKKPKMELSKEAWKLYDSLSGTHKAVFENMDSAERDHLVDKYISGKR